MKTGLTIEELAAEIMRENEAKEDYVVDTRKLRMEAWNSSLLLRVLSDNGADLLEPLDISAVAHRQIGTRLDIPAKYYNRMLSASPELLAYNVNHWFAHSPDQRMLRVLDGKIRAFLSNRYLRIDHHEVTCAVMPVIGEIPDVQFMSCQMTEDHMYIKIVNPNLQREIGPGDTIQAGLAISNSEIGLGSVAVQPMVYRREHGNGIISKAVNTKRIHSGPVYSAGASFLLRPESFLLAEDSRFLAQIRETVRSATEETVFRQTVERMEAAMGARLNAENIPGVIRAAGREFGITETEQNGVQLQLINGNDMSMYGLATAVSEHSAEVESYDRATELEGISYDILTMTNQQWTRINQAA